MAKTNSKLNMAAMKKAAKKLGLKLAKGDPSDAAEAIRAHMNENYESDTLAACGNCGLEANEDFDPCPYCGMELGEAKEDKPKSKKVKTKKVKTSKKKAKKTPKKKKAVLAKPDPKAIEECDERVNRIRGFKRSIAEEAYSIGVEIKEIHDKILWKHKGHKSFSAFCAAELEYTRVMAYKYMAMVGYKKEDAVLLGPSKCDMIAQAPKSKKSTLMKMGRDSKSRKEMQDYLDKGKNKTSPEPDNKITLVGRVKEDDFTIPWLGDKTGNPCKASTKGKHAVVELVSGVNLTVRDNGDEGLTLSFSRIEAE